MYGGSPVVDGRDRLSSYLTSPAPQTPVTAASPAFNERLRPTRSGPETPGSMGGIAEGAGGDGYAGDETPGKAASHAPSPFAPRPRGPPPAASPGTRRPPTRSLLDAGPGVMALRTPTSASGASPRMAYTPVSARKPAESDGTDGQERWVTVFGFPAAMEALVLRDFRRHGEVVRTAPGRGNWMHIMYRTLSQAQVAQHRPWRMVSGAHVMVGVTMCTEPDAVAHLTAEVDSGVGTPGRMVMMPSPSVNVASPAALRTPKSIAEGRSGRRAVMSTGAVGIDFGMSPGTPGMRTPVPQGSGDAMAVSPGPNSILRQPPPPRGIVSYISDWMSGA